jgi:hypothetical protein
MSSISVFHKQHGESQNKMRQVLRLLRDSGLLTRSVSHYTHSIVILYILHIGWILKCISLFKREVILCCGRLAAPVYPYAFRYELAFR